MNAPVSTALEQEVLHELRRKGIVVWLDKDQAYSGFVDTLAAKHEAGGFPFPVVAFRGSFLELLFKLEPHGSGLDNRPLLLHMPGFNEESIRQTPVLELYEAGDRFRKGLDTLVREAAASQAAPADVERFLATHPTLEAADAWLAVKMAPASFGLEALLSANGLRLVADALAQADSSLLGQIRSPEDVDTLRRYLHAATGLDRSLTARAVPVPGGERLDEVIDDLAAWVLCVEYVHDLKRDPESKALKPLRALSAPLVKACRDLATQLRRDNAGVYARRANEVEASLGDELDAMTADDLGEVDTFREESNRVLDGAIEALRAGQWSKAKAWYEVRKGETSFWLQRDEERRWEWTLVAAAAELGEALARHPRPFEALGRPVRGLDVAAGCYAAGAYEVDRAHRRFEQLRAKLLQTQRPHFGPLQEVAGALRSEHRRWADDLARAFAAICMEHGFLPPAAMQQRTLYEEVIQPLTLTGDKVAVFLIDAFRYEMATELVDALGGPGNVVTLKPRLAELPTVTSVGMNVLAPVAKNERLTVAGEFKGFKTGEYTVKDPGTRARAMGTRSAGKPALSFTLAAVCDAAATKLQKDIKPHPVIVVHSREIDDAGEANVGLHAFEVTLQNIKSAWHHLQQAGVKQFVFTADHGFLLQDATTFVDDTFTPTSNMLRRHSLSPNLPAGKDLVHVSVSALGYDGISGYLVFRSDTGVFGDTTAGATFVHGGNSPQERIIPVLTVTRKQVEAPGLAEYAIEAVPEKGLMGAESVSLRLGFVKGTTTSLGFASARAVELALAVPKRPDIDVLLKGARGAGALASGRIKVPVGDAWTEVFFSLEGPVSEQVHVEVHHPDRVEQVTSVLLARTYAVSPRGQTKPASTLLPRGDATWHDLIEDEGARKVFAHVEAHGAITEPEVMHFLNTRSAMRRFTQEFDTLVSKLPFTVRIEPSESGKRFVREDK